MNNNQSTLELFNEQGKQILQLKKTLNELSNNPLIYNGLVTTIKSTGYDKKIEDALLDLSCNEKSFEGVLMGFNAFTNEELIKKTFDDYKRKLSNTLEKKGQDHFSTALALNKGGIAIVKKIGINSDFLRREFRLTEKEVKKLEKDGFAEKYAMLKLNAILKHMDDVVSSKFNPGGIARMYGNYGNLPQIELDFSEFYYDDKSKYYNVDLNIIIKVSDQHLNASTQSFNQLVKCLNDILTDVQKEYHKKING